MNPVEKNSSVYLDPYIIMIFLHKYIGQSPWCQTLDMLFFSLALSLSLSLSLSLFYLNLPLIYMYLFTSYTLFFFMTSLEPELHSSATHTPWAGATIRKPVNQHIASVAWPARITLFLCTLS